jgi:hypothetical protein
MRSLISSRSALVAALLFAAPVHAQSDAAAPPKAAAPAKAPAGDAQAPAADPHAADPHAGGGGGAPDDEDDPHAGHDHGGGDPHGGGRGNPPGMFTPPPDTVEEDTTLPAGSFTALILDPDNKPLPHTQVTVGILHNTVAKGESRSRLVREADDTGMIRFDGQETGSGIAYRISVSKDGATFGNAPFNLPLARGMKARLHVYPVTRSLDEAMVVMQAVLFAEMKDDRVQLQSALQIFNFGRTAWIPSDVYVDLPDGFTAFRTGEEMSDHGIEAVEKRGGRLHGTFAPGRADVEFRWQLPYDGDKEVRFEMSLPPHVAVGRVMTQASHGMTLEVPGFPAAEQRFDAEGQRMLVTERQMKSQSEAIKSLKVVIGNIPTQGPGAKIAAGLTTFGVLAGIGLALTQRRPWKGKKELDKLERGQLLEELEELEAAHRTGEIGPKTYERARRELIDLLARTLSKEAR